MFRVLEHRYLILGHVNVRIDVFELMDGSYCGIVLAIIHAGADIVFKLH